MLFSITKSLVIRDHVRPEVVLFVNLQGKIFQNDVLDCIEPHTDIMSDNNGPVIGSGGFYLVTGGEMESTQLLAVSFCQMPLVGSKLPSIVIPEGINTSSGQCCKFLYSA